MTTQVWLALIAAIVTLGQGYLAYRMAQLKAYNVRQTEEVVERLTPPGNPPPG